MYTGTMIDDLMRSVQKAEQHAAEQPVTEEPRVEVHATYSYEFTYNSEALLGVA